jgi:hypothetical protein
MSMPDTIYATIRWNNTYCPPMPELKLMQANANDNRYPFCWIVLPPYMGWWGDAKITTELRYIDTVQEIFSIVRYEIEKMIPNDEVPPWELLLHGLNDIQVWFIEEQPDMRHADKIEWRRMNLDDMFEFVQSGMKEMGMKSW